MVSFERQDQIARLVQQQQQVANNIKDGDLPTTTQRIALEAIAGELSHLRGRRASAFGMRERAKLHAPRVRHRSPRRRS